MNELTLPSGKIVTIKKGTTQNFLNAIRKTHHDDEILFAIYAEIIEIDGQPVVFEDVLELDIEDGVFLHVNLQGKFHFLQQKASSTSAVSPAGN